jgi:sulfur-oxidizing protein SoxY
VTPLPAVQRRRVLITGLGAAAGVSGAFGGASAQAAESAAAAAVDPHPAELAAAIRAFAGDAPVRAGRVTFEIAPLVENGNAVPVTVSVVSPMSDADHVQAIAIFNERNPQREVVICHLGPQSGRAQVSTRIRLATSQTVVALAKCSDGSVWSQAVEVIVTIAACVEGT